MFISYFIIRLTSLHHYIYTPEYFFPSSNQYYNYVTGNVQITMSDTPSVASDALVCKLQALLRVSRGLFST
jgi:hypothetical protein